MQKDTRKNRGHPLSRKLLCIILAAGMLFTSTVSDTAYANDAEHPPETIEQTENVNNDDSETEQDTESEQSSEVKQNTESDEMVQDESSYQDAQVQDVQAEEDESNHDNEVMATSSSVQTSATLTNIGQIAGITVSSDRGRYDYYSSNKPNYARIVKFIPRFTDTYYISSVSSFDTYGRLYDGNMNSLTSDDDSAGNRQFKLTYRCEVGKTYYIAAGGYNSSSHTEELAVTITHDHTFDNNKRCVKCDFRQIYAILYNTGELHFQYWDTADPTKGSVVDKYQIASSYLYNPTAIPWFMKTNSIVKVTSDAISCSAGGIISMTNWFRNCSKLTSFDLSKFDTSGVTNMNGMFSYCSSLTSLDVSNFDTSKVTDMGSMFSGCSNLKAINLRGKFSTESLKSCDNIFTGTTADLLCDGNKKNAFPAEAYDYGKYIVRGPEFVYTGSQIVENNLQSMVLKPYKKDVKFDANGGAGTITIHVGVNDAIFNDSRWWSRKNICNNFGSLDDGMGYSYPTKSFYTFRGFFTQDGKELSNVNLITEDVYYAHWTPISYEINYNLNGGSISGQKTFFNIETDSFTLPTPTRNGYTFTGWTGSNGATAQKSVTIAKGSTGNKSYTANWTPTNYSISYNLNGGSLSGQKTSYNIETANFALPQPTRSGYTFTGWTGTGLSSATKSVTVNKGSTGNRSYTANWSANGYTISFNYNKPSTAAGAMSGNGTTSKGITYAAAYGTLPQPSMPGWTFNGWYTAASGGSRISATTTYTAAGNQTLYAHWTLNTYSISYNANGGSLSGQKTSYNVNTDSFALPTPTKNGYTFTGWTGSNGTTAQKSVTITKGSTGNRSYTAHWTPVNYTISYNANGGSLSGQKTSYNIETATFTLPTPTRTGYTFTGWTGSNGTAAQKSVTIAKGSTGNKSYTANWTPTNWTVKYNANGGTGTMDTDTATYNENYVAKANQFTRIGYEFAGWTENADGNGSNWTSWIGKPWKWTYTKNITLYAQWKVKTYTNQISHWAEGFKHREGNNDNKNALKLKDAYFAASYKSDIIMDSAKAVKIPNGYYLRELGTSEVDGIFKGYSIGLKLTQKPAPMWFEYYYAPISYSITYNLNGGTNNSANPSTYNVLYGVSLKAPTRAGYTFTGWYDESGNKVTGINEGRNATFSSADDLYAKLATRTTGNRTLTAKWEPISWTVKYDANGGSGTMADTIHQFYCDDPIRHNQFTRPGWTMIGWTYSRVRNGVTEWMYGNTDGSWKDPEQWYELNKNPNNTKLYVEYNLDGIDNSSTYINGDVHVAHAQWQYNPVSVKVPQILTGDSTGKSQFCVKCDDFKAGSIKITVPNNFLYKQTGKADVIATIASKSGNNTITSTNKACTYNITTENGLTAGCWQGSFNIGFTLTKE